MEGGGVSSLHLQDFVPSYLATYVTFILYRGLWEGVTPDLLIADFLGGSEHVTCFSTGGKGRGLGSGMDSGTSYSMLATRVQLWGRS